MICVLLYIPLRSDITWVLVKQSMRKCGLYIPLRSDITGISSPAKLTIEYLYIPLRSDITPQTSFLRVRLVVSLYPTTFRYNLYTNIKSNNKRLLYIPLRSDITICKGTKLDYCKSLYIQLRSDIT